MPVCAWLLALAGIILLTGSGLPSSAAAILAVTWLALALRSILAHSAGLRDVRRLVLNTDGTGRAIGRGDPVSLSIAPGSIVVGSLAWLRFDAGGRRFGVLVLPSDLGTAGWRRLNVLWRHGLTR